MDAYSKNKTAAVSNCRKELLKIMYEIGLIGVRALTVGSVEYAYKGKILLTDTDLEEEIEIVVHPAYHKTLGLKQF